MTARRGRRTASRANGGNAAAARHSRRKAIALLVAAVCAGAANAADVMRGADLYGQHCAGCHGHNGRPVMPNAPDFSLQQGLMKADPALLESIRSGSGPMPAYRGQLRDRDILDIVAHLRTLRR